MGRLRGQNQTEPIRLLAGLSQEPVKVGSVAALDALLKLRIDIHRHLRIGMADLAHHVSPALPPPHLAARRAYRGCRHLVRPAPARATRAEPP